MNLLRCDHRVYLMRAVRVCVCVWCARVVSVWHGMCICVLFSHRKERPLLAPEFRWLPCTLAQVVWSRHWCKR